MTGRAGLRASAVRAGELKPDMGSDAEFGEFQQAGQHKLS
jgi:hypothetical protein